MSEDVSATMRVGITVILVAALVATVLNLMVMSNSLLSGGQTTLQSGIDSVSTQEFASYDNTKVSGTQVATALSLFQGRDVAVIIQTKAFVEDGKVGGESKALNYGALITYDGKASSGNVSTQTRSVKYVENNDNNNGSTLTTQAKEVYIIEWSDDENATGKSITRPKGASNYQGYLFNKNGLVQSNYNTIGTTELGNSQYLLSSARFSSVLIKDPTGSIIGIFFRQLN